MGDRIKLLLVLSLLLSCALARAGGPAFVSGRGQTRGADSLSRWRPTRDYSGVGYVGAGVCAECHAREARAQAQTPMGHASERPAD